MLPSWTIDSVQCVLLAVARTFVATTRSFKYEVISDLSDAVQFGTVSITSVVCRLHSLALGICSRRLTRRACSFRHSAPPRSRVVENNKIPLLRSRSTSDEEPDGRFRDVHLNGL